MLYNGLDLRCVYINIYIRFHCLHISSGLSEVTFISFFPTFIRRSFSKMDIRIKPDIRISENCDKHETDRKIVAWCPQHDVGICEDCKENDHSTCDAVETLEEDKKSDLSNEFKSIKIKFRNIKKVYKRISKEREGNIESVKIQKVQIRDQIRILREKLNSHLVELENKLISELDEACEKQAAVLSGEIVEYKYRSALIDSFEEESAKAREYGTNLQVLLSAKQGLAMGNQEEKDLGKLNDTIKNYSVEFNLASTIQDVLNIKSLGSISSVQAKAFIDLDILKQNTFLPTIKRSKSKTVLDLKKDELRWDRTRVKRNMEFNMNTSLDKFLPEVAGAAFMPDDTILVADSAHQRLLQIKDKGVVNQELPLSFVPADVAVLGDSKVYVSQSQDRRVRVLDLSSLKEVDELILPSNASGMGTFEDKLLAVVCEKTGLYLVGENDSINIISLRNNEEGPIDLNADTIAYAETKKCLLHSFRYDGKKKFTVKVEGFGYVHGIAVLKDSSILVAKLSPGRHCIIHVSQDGKDKMLRLELNEITSPRAFAVDRKKRKILLVHGVRKISIFNEL